MMVGFPGGSDGKESACNVGDLGSIPRLGRSPGEGKGNTHSSIPAWRIPWTEEPGRVQSMGSQRVGPDGATFTFSSITDSVDMNLSKLWETLKDRESWHAAVHGVAKSWTRLSD